MRYVTAPPSITVTDPLGKTGILSPQVRLPADITLREYALDFWLNDPRWQKPLTRMASLVKVLPEFEKAPGATMRFEDADFVVLFEIVRAPERQPLPLYALQLQPFVDAILNARETET